MDGNDLGMIARVFIFLLKGLKYVLKLVWFTGLWWFCVPLVVGIGYEEITGTFIQNNQIMDGIFTILWYACYVLCPLNFLQNIPSVVVMNWGLGGFFIYNNKKGRPMKMVLALTKVLIIVPRHPERTLNIFTAANAKI